MLKDGILDFRYIVVVIVVKDRLFAALLILCPTHTQTHQVQRM
jgi:hypothetical protein